MLNKYNTFFVALLGSVLMCCLLSSKIVYAVSVFANGKGLYKDVKTPNDTYYGGFDMNDPGAPDPFTGSTDLVFDSGTETNEVGEIFGGGLGGNGLSATIDGDMNLVVRNTLVGSVCGGGCSAEDAAAVQCPANVTGTSCIRLYDSQVTKFLCGGAGLEGAFTGGSYVGEVDILIDNSHVEELRLTGRSMGDQDHDGCSILGDAKCVVKNASSVGKLMSAINAHGDIGGSVTIDVLGSKVETLTCVGIGTVRGDVSLSIGEDASKNGAVDTLVVSSGGELKGCFSCSVDAGSIEHVYCMPQGVLQKAKFVVRKEGNITNFSIDDQITPAVEGRVETLSIQVDGGAISNLDACAVRGSVGSLTVDVTNQGVIQNLTVGRANGSAPVGVIDDLTVNARGATLGNLVCEPLGTRTTTLILSPGGENTIENVSGSIDTVQVVSGSTTTIGTPSSNTVLNTSDMSLAGTLVIPENATLTLNTENSLVVDGGSVSVMYQDGAPPTAPVLVFDGALTDGLTIVTPLEVDASRLTSFADSGAIIPIAQANSAGYENQDLFAKKIQHQLLVGDIGFDPTTKVWSLSNIRPSENYYGYAAGRKASSWLNQQAMHAVHTRSMKTILNKHEGLWIEGQSGMENLHTTVGKSEMPWGMGSLGYDYHHAVTEKVGGGYGVALGVAGGWNKWKEDAIDVRNKIQMILGSCYAGYAYKGFYGIVSLQLAVGEVTSDNPGFKTNRKWSEVMPMESFELGWVYGAFEGLSIIPRGKVLIEQLSKRTVTFDGGQTKELLTLPADTLVSTIAGVVSEYDVKGMIGIDMAARLGLDWIRGIAGSYGVHSKVFNRTFEEKNKDDVLRITLGGNVPLGEALRVDLQIFGDMIDNTGFGAQATVGYMF